MMTKRSRFERQLRAQENVRVQEIAQAWSGSIPADAAAAFGAAVQAARERGPRPAPADMPPGTAPRPPRPGREPKPPKNDATPRRRR